MVTQLPAKILLVDDQLLFSNGLSLLLNQHPGFTVCGQIPTASQLLAAIHRLSPQIVLLDINLGGTNGIDLGKTLLQEFSEIKVLILTMYNHVKLLEQTRRAGLHGYLLKDNDPAELVAGIETVLAGGTVFDPRVLLPETDKDPFGDDFAQRLQLTFREVDIIRLIRDGLTNDQMADRLSISVFTVKTHRKNIHTKLGLTNMADLIQFANRHGI